MKKLIAAALLVGTLVLNPATSEAQSVNVRIDPLTMLVGVLNAEVDFKVSKAWTVGPTISYFRFNVGHSSVSASGLGVRGNYFFNGNVFTDSWYFGPFFKYATAEAEYKSTGSSAKASGTGLGALVGYHWSWTTFNMQLGGGIVNYSIPDAEITDNGDRVEYGGISGTGVALEFSIGWKF